ncbi:MAG: AtpZ/AtpI family protein [Acidiferrobacterales bacterium]
MKILFQRSAQSGYGTYLTSMLISGFMIGYGVDRLASTTPLFSLVFTAIGLFGGLYRLSQMLGQPDKTGGRP